MADLRTIIFYAVAVIILVGVALLYKINRQFRPAHIHYRLSHPEGTVFATWLLFADVPYLNDSLDANQSQTIKLVKERDRNDPLLQGRFDIVMPVTPPTLTVN